MSDTDDGDRPDRVILAFAPSDADHTTDGHLWSLYNPSLENAYAVADADEKIQRARDEFDPHDYDLQGEESWIRLDWQSVVDGDPERVYVERSQIAESEGGDE